MNKPVPFNHRAQDIPQFALYGETGWVDDAAFMHIEDIASRSRVYDWFIDAHRHGRLFQLLCIYDGEVDAQLDDRCEHLTGAWAITVPPGTVHSFRFSPGTQGVVISMTEPLLQDDEGRGMQPNFDPLFSRSSCIALTPASLAQIQTLANEIQREYGNAASGRGRVCGWLMRVVLTLVLRQYQANGSDIHTEGAPDNVIAQLKRLIESHYRKHWTVARYAARIGTSVSRLNRLCREQLQLSAKQMIDARLLLEAKRQLIYTRATLDEIAFDLGFKDPGYFSRYFRRNTGLPPGRFRKRNNFDATADAEETT